MAAPPAVYPPLFERSLLFPLSPPCYSFPSWSFPNGEWGESLKGLQEYNQTFHTAKINVCLGLFELI